MHASNEIKRKVLLHAPREHIWKALTDAEQFGDWFGIALKGQQFVQGRTLKAPITYPGYEHVVWNATIERLEPQQRFAFSWHPYAVDNSIDYDREPPTLVEFTLTDHDGGVLLQVVESGFDAIPQARRQKALKMNARGWDEQMANIENYLAKKTVA